MEEPQHDEEFVVHDDHDPTHCASCGSERIKYDREVGWHCADCGRTDADS